MAGNNSTSQKPKTKASSFLKGTILTDERVTRQFPFIIFIVLLGLILITNRYRSEKVIRQIELVQDTIDDLRSQSITNSAKLMRMSKPSEVVKKVREANLGLEEQVRAPKKIVVDKIKNK
jgi:hypothetical protein